MRLVGKILLLAVGSAALASPTARTDITAAGSHLAHAANVATAPNGPLASAAEGLTRLLEGKPSAPARTSATTATPAGEADFSHHAAPAQRRSRRQDPGASHYQFTSRGSDGTPARWNPCQSIHYVVNLDAAPAGALADVHQAIGILSARTGLRFQFDGTVHTAMRDAHLDEVSATGTGAASPLLIGWATPDTSDVFAQTVPDATGVTDVAFVDTDHGRVIDSGIVVLNAYDNSSWKPGFGPGFHEGSVLLHELGHSVGLAHVSDPRQIMYPEVGGAVSNYAAGDRTGLTIAGRGSCS